jgi:hypothetical protein
LEASYDKLSRKSDVAQAMYVNVRIWPSGQKRLLRSC